MERLKFSLGKMVTENSPVSVYHRDKLKKKNLIVLDPKVPPKS